MTGFDTDGYRATIRDGIEAVRHFAREIYDGDGRTEREISRLRDALTSAEAVVIGAGAGLSTAAGFTYSGARFEKYFFDFARAFGITDMYSGGFYPFPDDETRWAWWARNIWFNRYADAPKPVYSELYDLVKDRDYFVITTNVDHQFQRAGFDKSRLFYTQGDYGLFQRADGADGKTYDNARWVREAMAAQGFVWDEDKKTFSLPPKGEIRMRLPKSMIPRCPDGGDVAMNLRSDETFVEDEGWRRASQAYYRYLRAHSKGRVLYLELGVGANTPVIIKYPFWGMTRDNDMATYACVNYGEAFCPREIASRAILIDGDAGEVIRALSV